MRLDGFFKKYFYLKLCWDRAHSYIGDFLQMGERFALVSLWLKVYGYSNIALIVLVMGVLVCGALLFGKWDLKRGNYALETSLRNKYNPEIQKILEASYGINKTTQRKKNK